MFYNMHEVGVTQDQWQYENENFLQILTTDNQLKMILINGLQFYFHME